MKFFILIVMISLPILSFAQDDDETVTEESASQSSAPSTATLDPEKAKEVMEKLQKGQKMRDDQNKYLEELDNED